MFSSAGKLVLAGLLVGCFAVATMGTSIIVSDDMSKLSFSASDTVQSSKGPASDATFEQVVVKRYVFAGQSLADWEEVPFTQSNQLLNTEQHSFVVSDIGVWRANGLDWERCGEELLLVQGTAASVNQNNLVLAGPTGLWALDGNSCQPKRLVSADFGEMNAVYMVGNEVFLAPQQGGLFSLVLDDTKPTLQAVPGCRPITDVPSMDMPYGDWQGLVDTANELCNNLRTDIPSLPCTPPGDASLPVCGTAAPQPLAEPVYAITYYSAMKALVSGGNTTLTVRFNSGKWRSEVVGGIIDGPVSSLHEAQELLWIGTNDALQSMDSTFLTRRVGAGEGLPAAGITAITSTRTGNIVAGTPLGAAMGDWHNTRTGVEPQRRWMAGPRYLVAKDPSTEQSRISSLARASPNVPAIVEGKPVNWAFWTSTATGISLIQGIEMTLEDKAQHYQSIAESRHDRFGLVSDCTLMSWGDTSTCHRGSSDNDGLWTSMYTAGLAFKYAVTGDEKDRQTAWHHWEAMEFLNNVTGVDGLMARSILQVGEPLPGGKWFNSTAIPGWQFKGDTSSDEVCGHMMIHPIIHDLVAKTDEEKARTRRLVCNTANYIVDNNLYLIDADGNRTTWGFWNPLVLNIERPEYDERGLNSAQILGWLMSAHRMCPQEGSKFLDVATNLVEEHGYSLNVLNQKVEEPSDNNFSDDELSFTALLAWIWADTHGTANVDPARESMLQSIRRSMEFFRPEKPNLWTVIASMVNAEGSPGPLPGAVDLDLKRWPWELVNWPTQNSVRHDVWPQWHTDRFGTPSLSHKYLPPDETSQLRWNSGSFQMDGGSGGTEVDPGAWIMPYWMARYLKLVSQ